MKRSFRSHTHRTLYRLTCEDVEAMADEMGIPRRRLTEDFMDQVQRYIEKGFEPSWYEIVEFAIEEALGHAKKEKRQ